MNRRWVIAAGLVAAVLALSAVVVVVAKKPGIVDDSPSAEETIRQARERGIEGTITVPDRATFDENAEPIRHGPFLLLPYGWNGPEKDEYNPIDDPASKGAPALTTEEARKAVLWRDPTFLPAGYEFDRADSEDVNRHVRLLYKSPRDYLEIQVFFPQAFPLLAWYSPTSDGQIAVPIEVDGMPAILWHDPKGGSPAGVTLYAYEEQINTAYVMQGGGDSMTVEDAYKILDGLR